MMTTTPLGGDAHADITAHCEALEDLAYATPDRTFAAVQCRTREIRRHIDALEAALTAERARAERLREAFEILVFYGMPEHCEEARAVLHPGDLASDVTRIAGPHRGEA